MNLSASHPLMPIARKLEMWAPLTREDVDALLSLPFVIRDLKANHHVVWDGDVSQHTCLLVEGFAYRQKMIRDGGRQIFSIHMNGDLVDLQNSLLGKADHNVQMLTDGSVALVPVEAVRKIAFDRPAIGMAMWYETLVEGSIFREWITNIGRRAARGRIAHLLCELALRMDAAKLGGREGFTLPMSQEWIADAVSLTSVHVNRVLQGLSAEGLIRRDKRRIEIRNWDLLAEAGDFIPAYLHLDQVQSAVPQYAK